MRLIWRTMSPPISLYRCPESHMMLISKTIGLITPYLVHGYFVSCFPGWSFAWIPGFEMEIISLPLKGACVISVWAANITGHLIHLDKLRRKHALIFYVFFFYASCSYRTWVSISLQNILSFAPLIMDVTLLFVYLPSWRKVLVDFLFPGAVACVWNSTTVFLHCRA